ncbi:MAG: ABC transporter permease [Nitrospinota bacterium]|nr:MAG: ABC transporter permease [Nitrospinota bacterium]
MRVYIIRRALQSLIVCFGVSIITFLLLNVTGDPALLLLPPEATAEDVAVLREELGLNDPYIVQYGRFLKNILHGDFGDSFFVKQSASSLILERMPATIELAVAGLLVTIVVSIPLGIAAAVKRNSLLDSFASVFAITGQAMPVFWLGIMMIIVFGVKLHWFPVSGRGTPAHLVLPAITLGWYLAPLTMRLTRSGMLEVLGQEYIKTARSKGLRESLVLYKHALRNACIPVVTILGMQLGTLLGGAVVTETVFAWPGVASLAVTSIRNYDFPVVQAAVIIFAFFIVFANLFADIAVGLLDPRIRYD